MDGQKNIDGQKRMEAYLEKTMAEVNNEQKDLLNGMMRAEVTGCSFEEMSLTLAFPVQPWQANRVGVMHGAAGCAAFDMTMAAMARFAADSNFTPTVSLEVKFIRPVQLGDRLLVTVQAISVGKRISHFTGRAVIASSGKLAATATSVFMNVDTTLEKR